MLTLKRQLRTQAVEDPLYSLLLRIHHGGAETTQGIESVDESSGSECSLAEGEKLLREFVPLRQENELGVEAKEKSFPPKDCEVQPSSDSLPPLKGSAIQVLSRQTAPLNRREGHVLECLFTPLDPR